MDCGPRSRTLLLATGLVWIDWKVRPPAVGLTPAGRSDATFLDFEGGWCPGRAHFVRRQAGEMDWSAFMAGLPLVA